MPYFPVDDQITFHPKVIVAGNSALGAWTRAGAWCKAHVSGGFVPTEIAGAVGSKADIRKLVDARLWVPVEGGYTFHDWTEQAGNFDADTEKRRREESLARGRERKRAQREREKGSHKGSHGVTPGGVTGGVTSPPSPVPFPTDVTDVNESGHLPDRVSGRPDEITVARAKAVGISQLVEVCAGLAKTVGHPVSASGAILLVEAITSKSKDEVLDVDAYVATVCRRSPAEVSQAYFDLDIEGVS